jgi:formylglycine-generating enzyme required for sulfatase activity
MTNLIGMKLVWIPAGEFMMGSPMSEAQRHSTEGPQHRVRISKGFWMGAYEVTQQEYLAVTGNNPSIFDLPVESVSWEDAQGFCRRLSQKDGRTYRLPTEAEWEYACRGGTTGPYAGDLEAMAWHRENSGDRTHRVGQKRPNAFGVYDMHGNVFEWCQNWHGDYASSPEVDPQGPAGGSYRVLRGGSWGTDPRLCRSAVRVGSTPDGGNSEVGFRVVCVSAPN